MKYNLIILLSLLSFCTMKAQNNTNTGFKMEVDIPSQKGKKLYLGQYWKEATYAIDSITLSANGKAIINRASMPEQGQYFLYIKPDFQLDFLIGENQNNIRFYIDESDFTKSKVSGSKDTELLWEYLNESKKFTAEIDELREQLSDSDKANGAKTELNTQLENLEKKREQHTIAAIKKHEKEWFGAFVKGLELQINIPHSQPKNDKEFIENKEYGKAHYFDKIDLSDPRFWRTNYFVSHINTYMKQWVDQIPDSLAVAASRLVKKTKSNDFCFKEMLSKFINEAVGSKVMGDENIWARLYEDYILEKKLPWINEDEFMKLGKMYASIKNNRIGMKGHNLSLQTLDGKTINTNDTDSKFTLLYFYNPTCGTCTTETPKLYEEIYKKYKDKGVEIIAINIGTEKDTWKPFIDEHKLTDWVNCADFGYKSEYWMYYDTSGVPSLYVLNKNKVIVAKKLDVENLKRFFNYHYTE